MKDDAELRKRLERMIKSRFADEKAGAKTPIGPDGARGSSYMANAPIVAPHPPQAIPLLPGEKDDKYESSPKEKDGRKVSSPRRHEPSPGEPSPRAREILDKLPAALRRTMTTAASLQGRTPAADPSIAPPATDAGGNGETPVIPRPRKHVSLEAAADWSGIEKTNEDGAFYFVERRIARIWTGGEDFQPKYRAVMVRGMMRPPVEALHEDIRALLGVPDERRIYLDLETLGLGGERVFLIGLLRSSGEEIVVRQLLARDYSEEAAIIRHLMLDDEPWDAVVTYNGKSFDIPTLRSRAAVHHLPQPEPAVHVDLLHEARRRWGRLLPDCRLQTIEMRVCRRSRRGDIPGHEIPQAYHDFVKTGNAHKLEAIMKHNALDLLTLAQVIHAILSGEEGE